MKKRKILVVMSIITAILLGACAGKQTEESITEVVATPEPTQSPTPTPSPTPEPTPEPVTAESLLEKCMPQSSFMKLQATNTCIFEGYEDEPVVGFEVWQITADAAIQTYYDVDNHNEIDDIYYFTTDKQYSLDEDAQGWVSINRESPGSLLEAFNIASFDITDAVLDGNIITGKGKVTELIEYAGIEPFYYDIKITLNNNVIESMVFSGTNPEVDGLYEELGYTLLEGVLEIKFLDFNNSETVTIPEEVITEAIPANVENMNN